MDELRSRLSEIPYITEVAGVALLLLVAALADLVARRGIAVMIGRVARRSKATWDDALARAGLFVRLAHLVPLLIIQQGIAVLPGLPPALVGLVQRVCVALLIFITVLAAGALLTAINDIYRSVAENRSRPIKGYLQVARIALYVIAGLSTVAVLFDRSPLLFLSGLGAMTAVLLLIFKDTILSLVASIQITSNKMIRVGDWIEMPQYGADGDVVDVALYTVKVQNWDKTFTSIPTYKLIQDPFKNWRGMSESGARRIKRSVFIDVNTVRYLQAAEVDRFGNFELLGDYIRQKKEEIAVSEAENTGGGFAPHRRRLTNLGTLRAYIFAYLRQHPGIQQSMTLIVRQLAPGPDGLPLELYTFSNDTNWNRYEGIQSDIFDHILAIVPEFGLSVYQRPAGRDLARLAASALPLAEDSP